MPGELRTIDGQSLSRGDTGVLNPSQKYHLLVPYRQAKQQEPYKYTHLAVGPRARQILAAKLHDGEQPRATAARQRRKTATNSSATFAANSSCCSRSRSLPPPPPSGAPAYLTYIYALHVRTAIFVFSFIKSLSVVRNENNDETGKAAPRQGNINIRPTYSQIFSIN